MGCDQCKESSNEITINANNINNIQSEGFNYLPQAGENLAKVYDNYDFIKTLGEGGYGLVFLAKHKISKLTYAIKQVKINKMRADQQNSVIKEVNILRNLHHPHIISVQEYYKDTNHLYIVTEFCKGGELFDRIASGNWEFSEQKAAIIMEQVFSAINYCHHQGIVHRLPENLLLVDDSADSLLKVIDFGTSAIWNNDSKLMENVGTCYYIAPEVLARNYTNKCDIWSCGVILYILLCGYPPFNGKTDQDIYKSVKLGVFNFDDEEWDIISDEAKSFIKKLLQYDPAKRLTAEEALQDPWMKKYKQHSEKNLQKFAKNIQNLKSFRADRKLQLATWNFFVNCLMIHEEKEDMLKTFKIIDSNQDGTLSKEELVQGLSQLQMFSTNPAMEAEEIMKSVDIDHNGKIDYNEFALAAINRQQVLTNQRLETAFKMFDEDANGYISLAEMRNVFSGSSIKDNEFWQDIFNSADTNQDNMISLQEFKQMMEKLIQN